MKHSYPDDHFDPEGKGYVLALVSFGRKVVDIIVINDDEDVFSICSKVDNTSLMELSCTWAVTWLTASDLDCIDTLAKDLTSKGDEDYVVGGSR